MHTVQIYNIYGCTYGFLHQTTRNIRGPGTEMCFLITQEPEQ